MKNKQLHIYVAAALTMLIPVPGRFSYGIVLISVLNILMLFGVLFKKLISILKLQDFQSVLMSVFFIFMTIICKCIISYISPIIALVLGFTIFMPAVSSFVIGSLYTDTSETLGSNLKNNMRESVKFSIVALLFFLFRDILGYGTVSFPVYNGIKEIVIFRTTNLAFIGVFWASIPGALVMVAFLYILYNLAAKKLEIAKNTMEVKDTND